MKDSNFSFEWASHTAVYFMALPQHLESTLEAIQSQGECRQENSGTLTNADIYGAHVDLDQSLIANARILKKYLKIYCIDML